MILDSYLDKQKQTVYWWGIILILQILLIGAGFTALALIGTGNGGWEAIKKVLSKGYVIKFTKLFSTGPGSLGGQQKQTERFVTFGTLSATLLGAYVLELWTAYSAYKASGCAANSTEEKCKKLIERQRLCLAVIFGILLTGTLMNYINHYIYAGSLLVSYIAKAIFIATIKPIKKFNTGENFNSILEDGPANPSEF